MITAKKYLMEEIENLNRRYRVINKDFEYKIKSITNHGFEITIEVDYEEFIFKFGDKRLIYAREESTTSAFTGKRGGVGFRKEWIEVDKQIIDYKEISYERIIKDMRDIICNRLRATIYPRG